MLMMPVSAYRRIRVLELIQLDDLEESIQYEFGSTRDSGLSPATPQSADSDSLVLSLSAGN